MSRREEREYAYAVIFEKGISFESVEDIIENASLARDFEFTDFSRNEALGTEMHWDEIDNIIKKNIRNWSIDRISKMALAALRLAIYEILFSGGDVPLNVSVNEAVELMKKYGNADDPSFVNGVLSSVSKGSV